MSNEKPLIFISHKHTDTDIATAVAEVIKNRTLGAVRIFQSSNWKFEGPRFGPGLNNELRQALWNSDALILIYTSEDQNWQYCMYECGVATQPDSPNTRIVVFQCGRDVPTPFAADLRVDVHKPDQIKRFTKQLLTDPDFFPRRGKALAPDCDNEALEKTAEELIQKIGEQVADPSNWQIDEWPAWPFLRIDLPKSEAEKLEQASPADRMKVSRQVVEEHGVIVKHDSRAAALFGLNGLQERHKFGDLLYTWKNSYPAADETWFDSCCEQITVSARREFPVIPWARMRQVGGDADFTPVLSRVKRLPFGTKSTQFDIYFYNLSDLRSIPVMERMSPAGEFFHKSLAKDSPDSIKLKDLVSELNTRGINRIPVLGGEGQPLYIVHRSMIDKYVADNVWGKSGVSPEDFTLADLLAEPTMKEMFEDTFAVVDKRANLAAVKSAMDARPNCLDAFVTETGKRDEPVIGWLTNVRLARSV